MGVCEFMSAEERRRRFPLSVLRRPVTQMCLATQCVLEEACVTIRAPWLVAVV